MTQRERKKRQAENDQINAKAAEQRKEWSSPPLAEAKKAAAVKLKVLKDERKKRGF